MIDWWGPIIIEYYAGSEGNGLCTIRSEEWLAHPGSVGRPVFGVPHVLDDDGNELPAGQEGAIYFSGGVEFVYHNDPEKTAASRSAAGWTTLGDIGYLDAEGYLYLTDRKANMIISGGVNIYPQETENLLVMHPAVMDVAVFGVPDEDFGESVKADAGEMKIVYSDYKPFGALKIPTKVTQGTPQGDVILNVKHIRLSSSLAIRCSMARVTDGSWSITWLGTICGESRVSQSRSQSVCAHEFGCPWSLATRPSPKDASVGWGTVNKRRRDRRGRMTIWTGANVASGDVWLKVQASSVNRPVLR
jgi:hypothetical protein